MFLAPLAAASLVHLWTNLRFAVDMPYWDDYDAVLDFLNRLSSTRSLGRQLGLFLSLHNEHRLVFGRLVEAATLHLTGGVDFALLNLVGQLGLYLVVALVVAYGWRSLGRDEHLAAPAGIFLLAFSQNALMAKFVMASMQQYYQLLFALAALFLVTRRERRRWFPAVLLLATMSSFTGAGGLITFAVLFLYLMLEREWRLAAVEAAYTALVFMLYFKLLIYHSSEVGTASRQMAVSRPDRYLRFVLAFLGSVGDGHYLITGIGIAVVAAIVLPLAVRRMGRDLHFPALVATLVLAVGAGAGLSRLSMGVHEAAASRYAVYSLLLLSSVYLGLLLGTHDPGRRRCVAIAGLAISALLVGLWFSPATKTLRMRARLLDDALVYPDQARAMGILESSMKLGVFAPIPSVERRLPLSLPLDEERYYRKGYLGHLSKLVYRDGTLTVEGWAAVPPDRAPASAVFLEVNGKFYPTVYGYRRLYGQSAPLRYNARLHLLPAPPDLRLSVIVVGPERSRFYRGPWWVVAAGKSARRAKGTASTSGL
ncbi:MAG TPA: hypothetical protein VKA53_10535 [Thermoanaerobaculia bacterium]|nr:hypothetical protein [Thermoanaerobaculia bacterium]